MNKRIVVNDSMVLIHLAKITLLEKSCAFFKQVIIPQAVFDEAVKTGKRKGYADSALIEEIIKKGVLVVKAVKGNAQIKRLENYGITGGEAEAVALYWQENADLLACDDDNIRKKSGLLELELIGTPAIISELLKASAITAQKATSSITALKAIGWFSNAVLDAVLMEVHKNG